MNSLFPYLVHFYQTLVRSTSLVVYISWTTFSSDNPPSPLFVLWLHRLYFNSFYNLLQSFTFNSFYGSPLVLDFINLGILTLMSSVFGVHEKLVNFTPIRCNSIRSSYFICDLKVSEHVFFFWVIVKTNHIKLHHYQTNMFNL